MMDYNETDMDLFLTGLDDISFNYYFNDLMEIIYTWTPGLEYTM